MDRTPTQRYTRTVEMDCGHAAYDGYPTPIGNHTVCKPCADMVNPGPGLHVSQMYTSKLDSNR